MLNVTTTATNTKGNNIFKKPIRHSKLEYSVYEYTI